MIYKKRIITLPQKVNLFLIGVRGSGKTALLKELFPPPALYIDLLDQALYQSYLSNVSLFYEKINTFQNDGLVIVDEIQRMPQLLNEIHRLIESSSRRFILTGSSARKIKASKFPEVNLLAGRVGTMTLHPFVPEELGEDFNLNQALRYGLLPVVWSAFDNREFALKAYVETYLKEEIQAEALVRNLPGFTRFLEVAGLCHGQTVNMSAIASQCEISRDAVRDFFSILEDTKLGFFLSAYSSKLRLREKKHKKFYLIDPGLVRSLKKNVGPVSVEEKGFLFEGLVAQILRAYKDYRSLYESMYYWSPAGAKKTEVDFLLKRDKELIAIEVKSGSQVSSNHRGLNAIKELSSVRKRIVIYGGNEIRRTKDGIDIWPFDFFCKVLKEGNDFESPVIYKSHKTPFGLKTESVNRLELNLSFKPSQFQIPPPANEEKFERLCLGLYRAEFGELTQRNGRRGQNQDGVDIFVPNQDIGIQCKKREHDNGKITEQELIEEVEKAKKFKPPLKRFILATTCKRDTKIQETARLISKEHKQRNLFSVEIHSWEEIKELFDKHPKIYNDYYSNQLGPQTSLNALELVSSIKSDSVHSELNRIRDLMPNQPKTALKQLERFKQEKWFTLENKEKFRVITNMGSAKIAMKEDMEGARLFIEALQFDKENEKANSNCAAAWLIKKNIANSKKFVKKTKTLNPLNIAAHTIELQIKDMENKSLKAIISDIPEELKENHSLAYILSHISIRRKEYKEAEKWLKTFYKDKDENINVISDYADMSLRIILERQDVLVSRRAPSSLKNKVKQIIKIYQKLITDSLYNELRDFNPQWYIHYAIALELDGRVNKAIEILTDGEKIFSDLLDFPGELSRLFTRKGDIQKSISVMENITNQSSKKWIGVKSNEQANEKVDDIKLMLADLYFYNNQIEKGIRLLNEIIKKDSTNNKNKIEAQRLLIFRLINIKQIDKAEEELESLIADQENNIFNLILKSKIASYKGKLDKKIQYLEEAYNLLQRNNVHVRDIKHLADELYYSKMYEMSESLLEKMTNNNLNHHPEIFQLLHVYFENGKNKKAISLAKNLLKEFPHKIEPVNILFLIYESLGDREKAIQYYEKFISVNPENDLIKIDLVFAYVRNEQPLKAKELLNTQFNLDKLSSDWINKLAIAYGQIGNLKKALEIQYQNIKNNPNNLELQNVYIGLVSFRKKQDNEWLVPPDKVSLDCYVKIKETITQQEMEIPAIEKDADIYTPDHELSRKLLGKKVGDVIQSGVAQYQIMEIKNKYIQKFQEIIKEANLKFPSNTFMRTISVPTDISSESLSAVLKQFMSDPPQRKKQLNELFKYYRKGEVNIGFMSRIIGKHPIEVMEGLIQSSEHKFISSITDGEDENCQKDLENKSDIVIDLSALIVLHWMQMEKYIETGGFNLYVCQPTIDSLKELIRKRESHSKDGLLTVFTDENNDLVKDYMSPEKVTENLNFLMKIKKWSEEHCKIKSISDSFIMSRRKKMQWEKIIGKEFFDPLLTAHNEDNTILLCEDGLSGMVSKNAFQVSRVRLFDMIEYFEKQVIINNNEAIRFKSELVKLNQSYISIDHKILLYLLKESEYEISDIRFQRGLYFLGPISLLQGVIRVIADFLVALSQESSLLPYNEKVITKEVLNKASFERHPDYVSKQLIQLVKLKSHLLPINQSRICNNIKEWRNEKVHYVVLP